MTIGRADGDDRIIGEQARQVAVVRWPAMLIEAGIRIDFDELAGANRQEQIIPQSKEDDRRRQRLNLLIDPHGDRRGRG